MPTSIAQQDIQLSKSPGFMPTSIARRNIHTAKSSRSTAPSVPGYWHRIRSDNDDDDDSCTGTATGPVRADADDDMDLGRVLWDKVERREVAAYPARRRTRSGK